MRITCHYSALTDTQNQPHVCQSLAEIQLDEKKLAARSLHKGH
jgi:hypothetical protein